MGLTARVQLDFVRRLIAQFESRSLFMSESDVYTTQYVAIIALLRGVGHVFEKVDCDTAEKKAWAKQKWSEWKEIPIFKEFIDPTRDRLLKEFKGLESLIVGMGSQAVVAMPHMPGGASIVTDFDIDKVMAPNGKPIQKQLHEALNFWDRNLRQAEAEWA